VANRCYNCGAAWEAPRKPGFNERCPQCDAFLRCCLNCRLHDPGAAGQCRSSTTERVREKERPSFCEEFEFAQRSGGEQAEHKARSDSARARFDQLFKDP
jgi:hypothetical protein